MVVGGTLLAALFLIIDRGGLIAWASLLTGSALLAKTLLKPSKRDLQMCIGLATLSALSWVRTFYYVISTYESGEVVELTLDTEYGVHTARLWVFEVEGEPNIYFDAEPHLAHSLLGGKPLQFTRGGDTSKRIPKARKIDELTESEGERLLAAMTSKYGDRMNAATLYYVLLGIPRDRIALVANLSQPG